MFAVAAVALVVLFAAALVAACLGGVEARVAGTQTAGVVGVLLLLVASRATGDGAFVHVALVAAITSVIGGLLFARFLEHWL